MKTKKSFAFVLISLLFVLLNACASEDQRLNTQVLEGRKYGLNNTQYPDTAKNPVKEKLTSTPTEEGIAKFALTKTRFIFKPGKRGDSVTIVNTGSKTSIYQASFINRKMYPSGVIKTLAEKEANGKYSDELIHVTPKEFTIKPGDSQIVRLYARLPKNLAEGEYRSHLKFVILPDDTSSSLDDDESEQLSLKFKARPGFSLPVILRHGKNLSVNTEIISAKLKKEKGQDVLDLTFSREGNISTYGDLTVNYINKNQQKCQLSDLKGISIYPEVNKRPLKVHLTPCKGEELSDGHLQIEYKYNDNNVATKKLYL